MINWWHTGALFLVGYIFLRLIQTKLTSLWTFVLAYPAGTALYAFVGQAFLLCDFTMRIWRIFIVIAILFAVLFVVRKLRHIPFEKHTLPLLPIICTILSVTLIVSTGIFYIVMNYDSYFYFSDYGKTLAKFMCYKDFLTDDTYVLTNIGQFLPIVSSYAATWKLDTMNHLHVAMLINAILAFSIAIYEEAKTHTSAQKALLYTLGFTLMLVSCSPFFLFSNWLLSNSWILFYMLFLFIMVYQFRQTDDLLSFDQSLLLCGFSLCITMLRKDGLLITCFIFIAISVCQSLSSMNASRPKRFLRSAQLALLFLPSLMYMALYVYVIKHVLYVSVLTAQGTSLLSGNNTTLLFIAGGLTILYLCFLFHPLERICKSYLPHCFLLLLLAALGVYAVKDIPLFLDYMDVWFRNVVGISFGYSMLLLLFLSVLITLLQKKTDGFSFWIIGYILLVLVIYWNKRNLETDIDNSGLRAMYQIIPELFLLAAWRLAPVLTTRTISPQQHH